MRREKNRGRNNVGGLDSDSGVFESIGRIIAERTGLRLAAAESRLAEVTAARMAALHLSSPSMYLPRLTGVSSGDELRRLTAMLTVGETHFFRDRAQFNLLKNVILPRLIQNAEPRRRLCILSAGCSTGEEPYSIAMALDDIFPNRAGWDISILGVDIDEEAIKKAESGLYSEWSFRGTDAAFRERYFQKRGDGWELDERIRRMVAFRAMNLVEDERPEGLADMRGINLILCRNVFIYFDHDSVVKVFKKLAAALADGGYLLTGHAEAFGVAAPGLAAKIFPESVVYQRVTEHVGAPERDLSMPPPKPAPPPAPRKRAKPPRPPAPQPAPEDEIMALIRDGSFEAALCKLNSLPESKRHGFASVFLKAWERANSGEYGEAMDGLNGAARLNPLEPVTYYLMSQIHQLESEFEKAKEALRKALYLDPAFIPAHLELACLYERDNDQARARKSRLAAVHALGSMPPDSRLGWYDMTPANIIKSIKSLL